MCDGVPAARARAAARAAEEAAEEAAARAAEEAAEEAEEAAEEAAARAAEEAAEEAEEAARNALSAEFNIGNFIEFLNAYINTNFVSGLVVNRRHLLDTIRRIIQQNNDFQQVTDMLRDLMDREDVIAYLTRAGLQQMINVIIAEVAILSDGQLHTSGDLIAAREVARFAEYGVEVGPLEAVRTEGFRDAVGATTTPAAANAMRAAAASTREVQAAADRTVHLQMNGPRVEF